jgi:aminotransferase
MRPRPRRLERLPQQYFVGLLARVAEAAARDGDPLVDLGRGNPDTGPPAHVVEALAAGARNPAAHGYAPFRGLPALKEAIAERYRDLYGVTLDPEREVAVLAGTKTALAEVTLCTAERGTSVLLPDPGYPDYPSGVALAGAELVPLPLAEEAGFAPDFDAVPRRDVATVFLNYPSNPCAVVAPDGALEDAVRFAADTGAVLVHDFAYGDLVFEGRRPRSFLGVEGAREVGIELFSMSKTYGMAGWRLGFALGNAEVVARLEEMGDHVRAGVFAPVQEAGIAALTGPQDSVDERRALYEARRARTLAVVGHLDARCEGTFFVWLKLPPGLTAATLLEEQRVAVAPGEGFGARGAGWARISLATADERLDVGLQRLATAIPA